ncbi:pirin family protein [Pseudorhodoferax sp.]|uniref:pirin family protein n=1 Tax=Pseudorhodoferax sp. TaxID=1993553 RepID=UPI0039E34BFE
MAIELLLNGHEKDLGGGFVVRRLLPSAPRQGVGPFLFFDHFGPAEQRPEDDHDVRPHPHIGLATVTYLFEGAIVHRDSLGYGQEIRPGAVNWMTAGRGIVHSERRPARLARQTYVNHGLQLWAALPLAHEQDAPSFQHTPAEQIPQCDIDGAPVRVLVGRAFGCTSPVATVSETLYLDIALSAGAAFVLPPLADEQAVYAVDADLDIDGERVAARQMAVLPSGRAVTVRSGRPARLAVIGGAPLGHRHMWWNFVASRKELIVQAAADWEAGRFAPVPGETGALPLPERRFAG